MSTDQRRGDLLSFVDQSPSLLKVADYLTLIDALGSQSAVARTRHVSKSHVSETLSRFDIASSLPSPGVRGLILDGRASELLQAASELLRAAEDFHTQTERLTEVRVVRLGAFNSQLKNFVAAAVGSFAELEDDYRVLLPGSVGNHRKVHSSELERQLTERRLDYAILPFHGTNREDVPWPNVTLYEFELALVTHEEHPLRNKDVVTGADLIAAQKQGDRFVISAQGLASRNVLVSIFQNSGLAPEIALEANDTNTRVAMARAGLGIAIVHQDAIEDLTKTWPKLQEAGVATSGTMALAWRDSGRGDFPIAPQAHERLVELMKREALAFRRRVAENVMVPLRDQ